MSVEPVGSESRDAKAEMPLRWVSRTKSSQRRRAMVALEEQSTCHKEPPEERKIYK